LIAVIGAFLMMALLADAPDSRAAISARLLDGPGQVTALCRALSGRPANASSRDPVERAAGLVAASQVHDEAVQEVYQATVGVGEFRFRRYELEAQRLVIDTRWPLRAASGWLELDFGRKEIALSASPEQAEQAYRAWHSGQTRLSLTFDLDDETQCGGMELIAPRPLTVGILTVELEDLTGAKVLGGADDLAPPQRPAELAGREAAVKVAPVVVLSGQVDQRALQVSLRGAALKQCYEQALTEQPLLRGTVVFQTEVGRGGRPNTLRVALDDLDEPGVVACLHEKLSGLKLAGAASGARLLVPIELERPDSSESPMLLRAPGAPQ
jgi:hypothetical protein